MPSNSGWVTSFGGKIIVTATEGTLDPTNNRSQITITGQIYNGNANNAGPNANPLSCTTTGTDPQGNDLSEAGSNWTVGTVSPGATRTIITKTVWAAHDSSGAGTATVGWRYSLISGSATAIFGSGGNISVDVPLSQLVGAPDTPGALTASNIEPTSMTLSWDAVSGATNYAVYGQEGDSITSITIDRSTSGTTINLTGLAPGQDYTFELSAFNAAGWSTPSDPQTFQTLSGCHIRVDGVWKTGVPYVRDSGTWKMALPHIRVAGVWKQAQ